MFLRQIWISSPWREGKCSSGSLTSLCSQEVFISSRLQWAAQSMWTIHTPCQAMAVVELSSEPSLLRRGPDSLPVPCAVEMWLLALPRCKLFWGVDWLRVFQTVLHKCFFSLNRVLYFVLILFFIKVKHLYIVKWHSVIRLMMKTALYCCSPRPTPSLRKCLSQFLPLFTSVFSWMICCIAIFCTVLFMIYCSSLTVHEDSASCLLPTPPCLPLLLFPPFP